MPTCCLNGGLRYRADDCGVLARHQLNVVNDQRAVSITSSESAIVQAVGAVDTARQG